MEPASISPGQKATHYKCIISSEMMQLFSSFTLAIHMKPAFQLRFPVISIFSVCILILIADVTVWTSPRLGYHKLMSYQLQSSPPYGMPGYLGMFIPQLWDRNATGRPCSHLFHCVQSFRNEPTTSRCDRSGTVPERVRLALWCERTTGPVPDATR